VFPDGTKQTTAVEGGGGGVPAGFFIMGDTPTPPAGYTYTGEVITSSKGQWKVKASMPTARYRLAAAVVNNRIYVIGGESSKGSYSNKNEEYDPATNTWATKANMPTARRGLGVAAGYLEGWTPRLIAFGGYNGNYLLATTELYQPGTDEWQTVSDMNTETAYMGVAVVGYQIYAIGGMSEKVERWNVSYWETRAEMPEKGTELAAAVIDNKIYAIGGSGGNFGDSLYAYSTNYEYDTASNTWSARADIPTARKGFVAAAVNNKIYAIGGMDNTYTPFNTNEEYSPPITFYVHQKD
jgi:N-acetylneuraminic acid mutarotase